MNVYEYFVRQDADQLSLKIAKRAAKYARPVIFDISFVLKHEIDYRAAVKLLLDNYEVGEFEIGKIIEKSKEEGNCPKVHMSKEQKKKNFEDKEAQLDKKELGKGTEQQTNVKVNVQLIVQYEDW